MKRSVYMLLFAGILMIVASCASSSEKQQDEPQVKSVPRSMPRSPAPVKSSPSNVDQEVLGFLGADMLDVIMTPNSVESYRIDWRQGAKDGGIQGYAIISKGGDLNGRQIQILQDKIGKASSYEFGPAKLTKHRPAYAFRWIKSSQIVDITIDLNSRQWAFKSGSKLVQEDIHERNAYPVIVNVIHAVFKDDFQPQPKKDK